jgi:3-deoxy-D-manno-octulosonic-acid transferase
MIYDTFLVLGYLLYGLLKKKWLKDPLGRGIPHLEGESPLIWIHAVSVGETKAASTLITHIHKSHPKAKIAISTVTETGYQLAKTLIPTAVLHFRLPLDLSWVMRSLVEKLNPTLLILVEGDYWPQMLKACQKKGAKIFVVSGKLSTRSMKGYRYMRSVLKRVDHFFVQNGIYAERFNHLGFHNVTVSGNLKFDLEPSISPLNVKGEWVTIGSTHSGEEVAILEALQPLLNKRPELQLFLAPRHPERFEKVREFLRSYPRVHLIDRMGLLPSCYHHSRLAIVGGSYDPKIGGHDILEPVRLGIPVLFGPYMHTQEELKNLIEEAKVGESCPLSSLSERVEFYLQQDCKERIKRLLETLSGASLQTWKKITCDLKGI